MLNTYDNDLNAWHCQFVQWVNLTCHILDGVIDIDSPDWMKAGAWLAGDHLLELVESLPFPTKSCDCSGCSIPRRPADTH
jgi:hypothetical protein